MDALTAEPTQILFGWIDYGMDFLDPFNMLSVWLSGGRHNWANEEFDKLVKDAASFTGDPAERTKMFQDAERVLVEDVPAVFIFHGTPVQFRETVGEGRGAGARRQRHYQHSLAGVQRHEHGAGRALYWR